MQSLGSCWHVQVVRRLRVCLSLETVSVYGQSSGAVASSWKRIQLPGCRELEEYKLRHTGQLLLLAAQVRNDAVLHARLRLHGASVDRARWR